MNKPDPQSISVRRFTSWLVLFVFLVLGFCPLRNTLLDLAHPRAAAPRVPVYSKIIGQGDCVVPAIQKAIPATGKSLVPPLGIAELPVNDFAIDVAGFTLRTNDCLASSQTICSSFPIYLLNRCLLI